VHSLQKVSQKALDTLCMLVQLQDKIGCTLDGCFEDWLNKLHKALEYHLTGLELPEFVVKAIIKPVIGYTKQHGGPDKQRMVEAIWTFQLAKPNLSKRGGADILVAEFRVEFNIDNASHSRAGPHIWQFPHYGLHVQGLRGELILVILRLLLG